MASANRTPMVLNKPVDVDAKTGEVLVHRSNGKTRIRKGQSEEEYLEQLTHYVEVERGPVLTEVGFMDNAPLSQQLQNKAPSPSKQDRQHLSGYAALLYYRRQYKECASVCEQLLNLYQPLNTKNKIKREMEELQYMIQQSHSMLASSDS